MSFALGIKIQLFDTVAGPTLELVRQGKVDFAVTARLDSPEEFETQPLFNEPFFMVCKPDHPLAKLNLTSLRKLKGCHYIHTTRTGSVWHWVEPHLQDVGQIDTGFEAGNLETLAGLISNGFGVSVVPGFAIDQFRRRCLSAVRIDKRQLTRPLLMVKRRGFRLSIAAQELSRLIASSPPRFVVARAEAQASCRVSDTVALRTVGHASVRRKD